MRRIVIRIAILWPLISMAGHAPCQEAVASAQPGSDVTILRDTWGVPHIFGKTDRDAAFGLAYVHAEDDWKTLKRILLACRGRMATEEGFAGVPVDVLVRMLRIRETVHEKYATDLSPETRAVCEGYAAGLTCFATSHPGEVPQDLLPFTGEDIVAGFALTTPMFFDLPAVIQSVMQPQASEPSSSMADETKPLGSNTFAVAPSRSSDGFTRIAINSHQPWTGPVAWYEAHVHSEEGWDMVGGLFPGSPVILHGHNRNLGWAHTVNHPDLVDVYELKIDPANPNRYQLDGEWHDLEVREVEIEMKVSERKTTTIKKECLWSKHHGPVIRGPKGVFAIRYGGMGEIRHVEQWYRMNKAKNLKEFMEALQTRGLPFFNIGYADREGNIFYLYNAALPVRAEGYDWRGAVSGDTSETLWREYLPFERLPQVLNPASGFIQNCNNTPFQTTIGEGNPNPNAFSSVLGIETEMTNRAHRALELLGADESISREEFHLYKYDVKYSERSLASDVVKRIRALPAQEDPVVQEAIDLIGQWDFSADAQNRNAAMAILAIEPVGRAIMYGKKAPDLLKTLSERAHILHSAFGRLDVPWIEVNRLKRGTLDVGMAGGPDVLHAVYGEGPGKDGRLTGMAGDCFILMVEWDKEGRVSSESVHQFGSATQDESSPHYADQVPLFAARKLKPVWMDESEIRAHLEREYKPCSDSRTTRGVDSPSRLRPWDDAP